MVFTISVLKQVKQGDEDGQPLTSLIEAKYGHCFYHHLGKQVADAPYDVAFRCSLNADSGDHNLIICPAHLTGQLPELEFNHSVCSEGIVHFAHARHCPVYPDPQRSIKINLKKILKVGVCVIVLDEQKRMLVTRRTPHMRSFPTAFVFPGGQCDPNESLEQAGAREVFEETGIEVDTDSIKPLCVWESVFPPFPESMGPVSSHAMAFFYTAKAKRASAQDFNISIEEVDLCAWLEPSNVAEILTWDPEAKQLQPLAQQDGKNVSESSAMMNTSVENVDNKTMLDAVSPCNDGSVQDSTIPLRYLFGTYPRPGEGSGLARGHIFALRHFHKREFMSQSENHAVAYSSL